MPTSVRLRLGRRCHQGIKASRQINAALAQPVTLESGKKLQLFRVGPWSGWIEARACPAASDYSLRRTRSKSPAYAKGGISNGLDAALITVPPNVELAIKASLSRSDEVGERTLQEIVVSSPSDKPALYWLDWHTLPGADLIDQQPKPTWALYVHDANTAAELLSIRSDNPDLKRKFGLPEDVGWVRSQVSDLNEVAPDKPIELRGLIWGKSPSVPGETWVQITLTPRARAASAAPP